MPAVLERNQTPPATKGTAYYTAMARGMREEFNRMSEAERKAAYRRGVEYVKLFSKRD